MSILDPETIITTGGLALIAFIVFAESGLLFGFFFPGDTLLFLAGTLAAQGLLPIEWTVPVIMVSAILGGQVGYFIDQKAVFQAIKANETVKAEIPVHLTGEEIPAEKAGLLVLKQLEHVEVEALPADLIDVFEVDATSLAEAGDKLTVADLKAPSGVEIKTDLEQTIATVEIPKDQIAEADAAAADLAEDAGTDGAEEAGEGEAEEETAGSAEEASADNASSEEKKEG